MENIISRSKDGKCHVITSVITEIEVLEDTLPEDVTKRFS